MSKFTGDFLKPKPFFTVLLLSAMSFTVANAATNFTPAEQTELVTAHNK